MRKFLSILIILVLGVSLGFAQKVFVRDAKPEEWGMLVKSPIFGIEFKVRKDTKVAEYRGKVYYFDSRKELEMFLENPRKYAGPSIVRRSIPSFEIGRVVISPVSGKIFVITPSIISVEYDGKIYYFLSEAEYKQFEQDPEMFPELSVDIVVLTNVVVRTNYIIITNIQLVNEYDIKTNYIVKTNVPAIGVFRPQVLGQSENVVVVKEEPKVVVVEPKDKVVVVEPKRERVTTVVITIDEERKLIKFQKKKGNQVIIVREAHPKEIGKIAVSPISGEFVITGNSVVVKFKNNVYYLRDDKEADLFVNKIDIYTK